MRAHSTAHVSSLAIARLACGAAAHWPLLPSVIRLDDKLDWAPMQQLYDAGLSYDPVSAMPVFDPSACAPALLKALWRGFCGVADTINTKQMGQTDEALDELQMRLHEHAAQLRETAPCSSRLRRSDGTPAKQSCRSARSLSDEDAEQCADGDAVRERLASVSSERASRLARVAFSRSCSCAACSSSRICSSSSASSV